MPDYYKKYFKNRPEAEDFRLKFNKKYGYKPKLFSIIKCRKINQRFFVIPKGLKRGE